MVCLKYAISCLIRDKVGPRMNEIQCVTVFASLQERGLCHLFREAVQRQVYHDREKGGARKQGGAARSPRPPWASEPRLLVFEAAAKHLLSSYCVPGKGRPEDMRLRSGTTRAFFSNLSVQGSLWSPSHVTET